MPDPARVVFDTSALLAALVQAHPKHSEALAYLNQALGDDVTFCVGSHTLAELYEALTRLPVSPQIAPGTAQHLIRTNVTDRATIIPLDGADYTATLHRLVSLDLSGTAIYDALHVRTAEKARADQLVTLHGRAFRRIPPLRPIELVVL